MASIYFTLNGNRTSMQCSQEEKIQNICQRFAGKSGIDYSTMSYLYDGNLLNQDITLNELTTKYNKNISDINILVLDLMDNDGSNAENNADIKSEILICPKCKEKCRIKINDYKIALFDCKNGHSIDNIAFAEYNNTQIINESKILCGFCKNNKNEVFNKQFYLCLNCGKNCCPLCLEKHDKNHKIINFEKKDYICNIHKEIYISYCKNCRTNLCMQCELACGNHTIIQKLMKPK